MEISKITVDENFTLLRNRNILYADSDKLSFPLTLRHWQEGDTFQPLGMKGTKKVSDFFSDNKFSLIDKENTWILCSGDDIIWIVGYRPDERFKVSSGTKNILRISL